MEKEIFRVELPLSNEERKKVHERSGDLNKPRSLVNFYLAYNPDVFDSILKKEVEDMQIRISGLDLETLVGKTVNDALLKGIRRVNKMIDLIEKDKINFYKVAEFLEYERNFLQNLTEDEEFMVDAYDYYIENRDIDSPSYFHHILLADVKKLKETLPSDSYLLKDYMKGKDKPFRMTSKRVEEEGYYAKNEFEKIIIDFMRTYFENDVETTISMVNQKGRLLLKSDNKALEIFSLNDNGVPIKLNL